MKLLKYTKTAKGWKVDIPASLTGDKRRREFYPTRERAEARVNQLNDEIKDYGSGGVQIPPHHYHDCANAIELLEGYDITLSQIAQDWINRNDAIKQSVTLVELAEAYVESKRTLSKDSKLSYPMIARIVSKGIEEKPTHDLITEDIENNLSHLKDASFNSYRRHLSAMFKWGAKTKQGYHVGNIIDEIETKQKTKVKPLVLGVDQVQQLLDAAQLFSGGRYLPYYVLSLFCGIRRSELKRLDSDNIKEGHVYLSETKTGEDRYIALIGGSSQWVELCKDKPVIVPVFDQQRKLLKLARITNWQRNIMRHTACSMHWAYHQDEGALTSWAGHSIEVNRKHYRHAVLKQDAIKFWSSTPQGETVELLRQIV